MAENWVNLQNSSVEPQSVFDEQTQRKWTMEPKTILSFPERIAKLFLAERPRYISIYQPPVIPDIPGEATVWLANATGNPFLSTMVKNRKGVEVSNPNLKPMVLERKMGSSQTSEHRQDGFLMVTNHPPITIVVAPYTRFRCPISVANWLEQRDSQQEPEAVGKLIRAREPGSFEPNETWSLDELRIYAYLVDEKGFDIENEFPHEKSLKDALEVSEVKGRLMKKLFFRVIDPIWNLPSKSFFEKEFERMMKLYKSSKTPETQKATQFKSAQVSA